MTIGTMRTLYDQPEHKLGRDGVDIVNDLFDYTLYFRLPERRAWIAIVGQPYDIEPARACEHAQRLGLRCHVPPNALASWHYPGWTRFFCFTRPEIECVRFLPDQMEAVGQGPQ